MLGAGVRPCVCGPDSRAGQADSRPPPHWHSCGLVPSTVALTRSLHPGTWLSPQRSLSLGPVQAPLLSGPCVHACHRGHRGLRCQRAWEPWPGPPAAAGPDHTQCGPQPPSSCRGQRSTRGTSPAPLLPCWWGLAPVAAPLPPGRWLSRRDPRPAAAAVAPSPELVSDAGSGAAQATEPEAWRQADSLCSGQPCSDQLCSLLSPSGQMETHFGAHGDADGHAAALWARIRAGLHLVKSRCAQAGPSPRLQGQRTPWLSAPSTCAAGGLGLCTLAHRLCLQALGFITPASPHCQVSLQEQGGTRVWTWLCRPHHLQVAEI